MEDDLQAVRHDVQRDNAAAETIMSKRDGTQADVESPRKKKRSRKRKWRWIVLAVALFAVMLIATVNHLGQFVGGGYRWTCDVCDGTLFYSPSVFSGRTANIPADTEHHRHQWRIQSGPCDCSFLNPGHLISYVLGLDPEFPNANECYREAISDAQRSTA